MNSSELRAAYLNYFKSKGHAVIASSSLVPANDPTLLFSNAGMNQFKDCFLGADKRAYTRAATSQKCLRISGKHNDLENVGVTARHHTFFEMLGNFSFGDYFKKDAIAYAWEFVTGVLKLPKERLWVTIFESDQEAGELWQKVAGVAPERIVPLGEKDNFWAMGDTGPCGPCTEIHVYLGKDLGAQSREALMRGDTTFLEIWNLVFMQFDRAMGGKLTPLPKPSVDTGMGLERICQVVNGVGSNYDTDLFRDIISVTEQLSGFAYDGKDFTPRDLRKDIPYARDVAMRVIADHSRAVAFLIADGVHPGSDGRGYVLRRLIRRAVRHSRVLQLKDPFLAKTTDAVVAKMSAQYPELKERHDTIRKVADAEERKFQETIDAGLEVLQREVQKLGKNDRFPGEMAFLLHDTYGFPLDLTEDALKPFGLSVDVPAFQRAMDGQRSRSREDRKSRGITFVTTKKLQGEKTKFLGYETGESEGQILDMGSDLAKPAKVGESVSLVLDQTPFYAESGGQVGDTGYIRLKDVVLEVIDTQKVQDGYSLHECVVVEGEFAPTLKGERAHLKIDEERRRKIRANHSATHLVHSALRKVAGEHVKQAGSRVDDHTLRFDYSHFEPLSASQLQDIQGFVNEQIRANHEVSTRVLPIDEARKTGAVALFGEKYGATVRVVQMGPHSIEFCGGTHVSRTGDIGLALVQSETGVAAGVRRIECFAGSGAEHAVYAEQRELRKVAALLKSDPTAVPMKVEKLLEQLRSLERELSSTKGKLASNSSGDLVAQARTTAQGVRVIATRVPGSDAETLRTMVDQLRAKLGSGVVALASEQEGKGIIVAGVTEDLVKKFKAGDLVREAAKVANGRGGGRPDFAQAGGLDLGLLEQGLEKVFTILSGQ